LVRPERRSGRGCSLVRVCPAIKANGERCRGIVGAGNAYCPAHDPAREGARRRAASKAAKSKPDAELKGVKDQLQALADRVLSGELQRADAAVVSQVLNVKLRALELERKWRELGELEDRLEALEGVLKRRNAG
jgi:glutathione S-transferase